ncbi:STAS/SEC14 domain-containing protein [Janibacter sp. GS2]|uniref:STAS/SEC14 domain-containing protein n=1 Tax=Janibacter sp. GS2 TaxID=3442646 RepID=UPI003EBB43FE
MLTTSVIDGTNIVSVTLDGSVSADEDDAAQREIAAVAAEHGKARMLLDYEGIDLSRVEPRAVWEDLKGVRLLGDIDRVGVVADSRAIESFAEVLGAVSAVEVRAFGHQQREAAVAWLSS